MRASSIRASLIALVTLLLVAPAGQAQHPGDQPRIDAYAGPIGGYAPYGLVVLISAPPPHSSLPRAEWDFCRAEVSIEILDARAPDRPLENKTGELRAGGSLELIHRFPKAPTGESATARPERLVKVTHVHKPMREASPASIASTCRIVGTVQLVDFTTGQAAAVPGIEGSDIGCGG